MHFLIIFIFVINILHSKYLLAKSKYQIYHIFLNGGYMSGGYFARGLLSLGYMSGGICPDTMFYMAQVVSEIKI